MIEGNYSLVDLEAVKVRFFSHNDESAFFEWVEKIPSVKDCKGKGLSIFLSINNDEINEYDLRELISLFWRYGISMKQLSIFDREPFSHWFRDENAYWFVKVFGE